MDIFQNKVPDKIVEEDDKILYMKSEKKDSLVDKLQNFYKKKNIEPPDMKKATKKQLVQKIENINNYGQYQGLTTETLFQMQYTLVKIFDKFSGNYDLDPVLKDMENNKKQYISSINGTLEKHKGIQSYVDPLILWIFVTLGGLSEMNIKKKRDNRCSQTSETDIHPTTISRNPRKIPMGRINFDVRDTN